MIAKLQLFLVRRAIRRCEKFGLLVIEKTSAQGAFDTMDTMLNLLATSGHLHNGDQTQRRLAVTRKLERGSQLVAKLLRQGSQYVSFLVGRPALPVPQSPPVTKPEEKMSPLEYYAVHTGVAEQV